MNYRFSSCQLVPMPDLQVSRGFVRPSDAFAPAAIVNAVQATIGGVIVRTSVGRFMVYPPFPGFASRVPAKTWSGVTRAVGKSSAG